MKLFKRKEIKINEPKYKVGDWVKYCIENNKPYLKDFILLSGEIVRIEGKRYFISKNGESGNIVEKDEIISKICNRTDDKEKKTRFVFECSNCKTISNDLKMIGLASVCPKCGSDKITCLEVIG